MFLHSRLQCNGQFSKCRLKATVSLVYSGSCLERFLLAHPYILFHTRISCQGWLQALTVGITGQSLIISLQLKGLVCIVMLLIPTIPTLSMTSLGLRCSPSTLEKFQPMTHYQLLELTRNSSKLPMGEQPGNRYSKTFPMHHKYSLRQVIRR